jgi:hypothetical protein
LQNIRSEELNSRLIDFFFQQQQQQTKLTPKKRHQAQAKRTSRKNI